MILLDGKKLRDNVLDDLKTRIVQLGKTLTLSIVFVGDDFDTKKFIEQKKNVGEKLGVEVRLHHFLEGIRKEELMDQVRNISRDCDGIIVQLKLPGIDREQDVLDCIPPEKDVDVLSVSAIGDFRHERSEVWPPIVAAVKNFFDEYKIDYIPSHFVLVGGGKLVGGALDTWLKRKDVDIGRTIITKSTLHPERFIKEADILITGVPYKARFITGDMVKDGVVIIDAGIVKEGDTIVGNVDFESVGKKASFITPVPGGIGPLMVAMVYKNLVILTERRMRH